MSRATGSSSTSTRATTPCSTSPRSTPKPSTTPKEPGAAVNCRFHTPARSGRIQKRPKDDGPHLNLWPLLVHFHHWPRPRRWKFAAGLLKVINDLLNNFPKFL